MESKNLNTSGEAAKSLSDMKKDFVKGVRKMNSTKEIPDYSGEFAEAVKEHAAEDYKQYSEDSAADSMETVEEYEESMEKSSVKGVGWLLGIVAAFVICVGIAALVGHKDSPYSSRSDAKAAYSAVDADKAKAPEANGVAVYGVYESESVVPINGAKAAVSNAADKAGNAVAKAASSAATAVKGAASSAASAVKGAVSDQSYDDRIEREAREVIHGDYGNNPERAKELGPDYAAVQERVNEILNGVHS